MTNIDHFVVGAATLSAGVEYVNQLFGVTIPYGGQHEMMGTHNHLMQLGKGQFLEVIAINPKVSEPDRSRWYGLDNPDVKSQISRQPRLLTWVVNTTDIKSLTKLKVYDFGMPTLISRDHLSWYFGLPDDGNVFEGGTVPYIMQWNTDKHPAAKMTDLNCKFTALDLYHPNPRWLEAILSTIDVSEFVSLHHTDQPAHIIATIDSPAGLKQLSSLTG